MEVTVPDGDIFCRVAAPGWTRPVRQLYSGGSAEEVTRAILHALARSLRDRGGIPALPGLSRVVQELADGQLSPDRAFQHVRAIEVEMVGNRHCRVAAEAARQMIVEMAAGVLSAIDATILVPERVCTALVAHHVFERGGPELADRRFGSETELHEFQQDCWRRLAPGIVKLSEKLAQQPTGEGLRAPSVMRRQRRKTTAELLEEPLS